MNRSGRQRKLEFNQVALLIEEARSRTFQKVNEELVLLYFKVGHIVAEKVESGNWGDSTVEDLAQFIEAKFPELKGFNRRGLYRMKQFYEIYATPKFILPLVKLLDIYFTGESKKVSALPTQFKTTKKSSKKTPILSGKSKAAKKSSKKVSALPTQLTIAKLQQKFIDTILIKVTWSNHLEILTQAKSPEEKFFYLLLCIKEKWSMRELRRQLTTGLFERTMLSNKKPAAPLPYLSQHLFKDPYIFEFLNLPEAHSEKDVGKALMLNLQKFILEIGKGFTYMGSQYRLQIGNKDYYTDLLFYHRDLKCLVLFELKIQEFEPEFLGKLNFYLEALDRDVKRPGENPSIGVLLCKGKDKEVVEYAMARNTSPTLIADYATKLIPKNVLAKKLHQLVELLSQTPP